MRRAEAAERRAAEAEARRAAAEASAREAAADASAALARERQIRGIEVRRASALWLFRRWLWARLGLDGAAGLAAAAAAAGGIAAIGREGEQGGSPCLPTEKRRAPRG